ncbi:MAG: ABC transporter permease subunit [Chloroflexi bacterium]|nr:ABC transporter permease subunit [Chloroflexota bacterium]
MAAHTATYDQSARKRLARALHYAAVVLLVFLLLTPLIAFLFNAFSFRWFYPQLFPTELSLRAWESIVAANSKVPEALLNSTILAVAVTFSSVVIGMPAARALGLYTFRGKRVIEFLIISPTIVPGIAVAMGLNINFIRWGLAGNLLGVGLVHLVPVMPYVVLTLAGVFANYDPDFEQQARSLGAGTLRTFWHVTLPAVFPGIVVASLFAYLISWSQYILTFLIGAGQVITMPVLLFSTASGSNNPLIAAMSLVFVAPSILILVLTARFLSGKSSAIGGFGQL